MEEIFTYIQSEVSDNNKFMVRASYLQIYNETISDLLKTEQASRLVHKLLDTMLLYQGSQFKLDNFDLTLIVQAITNCRNS